MMVLAQISNQERSSRGNSATSASNSNNKVRATVIRLRLVSGVISMARTPDRTSAPALHLQERLEATFHQRNNITRIVSVQRSPQTAARKPATTVQPITALED
jgi:hypothetical protein